MSSKTRKKKRTFSIVQHSFESPTANLSFKEEFFRRRHFPENERLQVAESIQRDFLAMFPGVDLLQAIIRPELTPGQNAWLNLVIASHDTDFVYRSCSADEGAGRGVVA